MRESGLRTAVYEMSQLGPQQQTQNFNLCVAVDKGIRNTNVHTYIHQYVPANIFLAASERYREYRRNTYSA